MPWKVNDISPICLRPSISKTARDAIEPQWLAYNYYTVCCWLAILATAWLLVIFLDVFVYIRKVSLEVKFCLNTFRYSYFYFPINIWCGSHSAVFANLWYSVTKFWIGQYCIKNASQKFTTSWTVFVGRWTHLKKMRNQSWQKTK